MDDKEKLIELLGKNTCKHDHCFDCEYNENNDTCITYLKSSIADLLIASGVTFQKWIPVTERLPDIGGCYLVVVKYKYDFEKEYNYDTDVATFHFGYESKYIDGQWNTYVDWDEGQQYLHVTHWMPLPEPPKEESNG